MKVDAANIIRVLKRIGEGNMILDFDQSLFSQYHPYNLNQIAGIVDFNSLDDSSLVLTFIGMVRIETEMNFRCESTSPALKTYKIISERGIDHHLLIANWAFQYANNDYIPFGIPDRRGSTTAFQFKGRTTPSIVKKINANGEFSPIEKKFVFSGMICPYCGNKTDLVDSAQIYNGTSYGMIYICQKCNAYVGCYKGTHLSLGMLANKDLREAKKKAHHYLDQLWKPKVFKRPLVYNWLSNTLNIPRDFTHIGMSNIEQCNRIIEVSIARMKEEGQEIIPYPST